VREHTARGVDVIKIMASGGNLTPGTRQHLAQFSPEVLRAAVEEAHRLGLPVTVHAHAVGMIADVAAGVDGLEHVSFWTGLGMDAPPIWSGRRIVVEVSRHGARARCNAATGGGRPSARHHRHHAAAL
jgi:Amidohydrolase family